MNSCDTFEPYEAYRYDPKFHEKVNIIARDNGMEPIEVISREMWHIPVSDRRLGLFE